MNVWSEKNHVVNAVIPVADAWDAAPGISDIVNMENYRSLTFIVACGATTAVLPTITVLAGNANDSCTQVITFKYRKSVTIAPPLQGSDVFSALTDATTSGFAMTATVVGATYIIEVDAAVVAAAGTNFDHVRLNILQNADTAQTACVLAILSEPRYAQDVLATAID